MPRTRLRDGIFRALVIKAPGAFGCVGRSAGRLRQLRFEEPLSRLARQLANHVNTVVPYRGRACKPHLRPRLLCGAFVLKERCVEIPDRRRRGLRGVQWHRDHSRGGHLTALLDLVPGRSGTVYKHWLAERGEDFRAGVHRDARPFQDSKNAIDDQLQDATGVLDAFTSSSCW